MQNTFRYVRGFLNIQIVPLLIVASSFLAAGYINTSQVSAAVCGSEPTSTTGKSSQSVTVPATGTYTIWSRMKAPSTTPVEYQVYIDGQCFTVGQTALSAGTLTWVDYENGTTSDKATISLTAGTHTLVLTAGSEDLELDRVMFLSDSCTPTGTGDNCLNDTTNPVTSITSPSNGATVSASTSIQASATDNDAIDYVEFYRDGTTLLGTDTTAPYSYAWDTTTVLDGPYSLTARSYDLTGNTHTSTAASVTVNNTTPVAANITSFTASPASIVEGQSSTLSWSVTSGENCSIDQAVGVVSASGSQVVSPISTTTYTLTCAGLNGGSGDSAQTTLTVTPAPVAANITSFTATPPSLIEGQTSTLDWTVSSGQNCSIDQGVGSVGLSGSQVVSPVATTTYSLTCQGLYGGASDSQNVSITVTPAPINANITSFTATPASITDAPGQSSTLAWAVAAGTGCSINQSVGSVATTGSRAVSPLTTTTYTLSCNGQYGGTSDTAQVTVTVTPAPDTDGDGAKDYVEDAAPNAGDVNNDGTQDTQQDHVVSLMNVKTSQYNTIVASSDCDVIGNATSASGQTTHIHGTWSFTLTCLSPGQSGQVEVLLDKQYDVTGWSVVKLNTAMTTSEDITSQVTLGNKVLGARTVTSMNYTLNDGGALDEDGTSNGAIVDPVAVLGAATTTPSGSLSDTGESVYIYGGLAALMVAASTTYLLSMTSRKTVRSRF